MALRLYNTLTKREEDFTPRDAKRVTMYTCGPTVYSRPHVGNYASFLMADLLRRWLEAGHDCDVVHVKNITDVGHLLHDSDHGDDKIQKEAEREKLHPLEIAKRYTDQYRDDECILGFLEPKFRPRASEYVPQMLVMVKELLTKGHAYELPDAIYFDVTSRIPTPYGTLSGNTLESVKAGARVGVNKGKRHPADFALWKKCIGDNARHVLRWDFATGNVVQSSGDDASAGFPGWHIECSAMSRALLGDQIDIHTGGEDNIFPHHECEIAQSEAVSGKKPFVQVWLHRRRINLEGEKMSKSLGNVLTLPDIVAKGYDPMDLRYYLLSVHYRTNLKFSWKGMEDARKARRKVMEWMEREAGKEGKEGKGGEVVKDFCAAMDSDLNTPAALAAVFDAMKNLQAPREHTATFIDVVRHTFGCFDKIEEVISSHVQALIQERQQARDAKNFAESDRLRKAIEEAGYEVRDGKEGQVVKKK
ncbi:MAG: cysteinyl-tRNA synthetase [Candidatus Peregrinibacteria bacterium Gr01-1014_25]|nr:MAG: cysteinyl-tRNA synthetase [Candidatus Peregrinibacteria bacterium Gr01-1014_25]